MEIVVHGLISILDMEEEKISELEGMSIGTSKLKCNEKKNRIIKNCGTITKGIVYT